MSRAHTHTHTRRLNLHDNGKTLLYIKMTRLRLCFDVLLDAREGEDQRSVLQAVNAATYARLLFPEASDHILRQDTPPESLHLPNRDVTLPPDALPLLQLHRHAERLSVCVCVCVCVCVSGERGM